MRKRASNGDAADAWRSDKAREGHAHQNEAANAGSCSSTCASALRSAGSVAVDGVVGFGRGCVFGRRRLGLRLARRIDLGAVDLDQTDGTSVDSRRGRFPACSPLVRMYGSIFMSFRRKAISTLRSPSMA